MTNYSHEKNATTLASKFKCSKLLKNLQKSSSKAFVELKRFMKKNQMEMERKSNLKIWSKLLPK